MSFGICMSSVINENDGISFKFIIQLGSISDNRGEDGWAAPFGGDRLIFPIRFKKTSNPHGSSCA
jgi:hypothetical protein